MTAEATSEQLRRSRAYLLAVTEPPAPTVAAFAAATGPIAAAERIRTGDAPAEVAAATADRADHDITADFDRADEHNLRLIIPEDDEWPHWAFRPLHVTADNPTAPPLALWARGRASLDDAVRNAVTLGGSRSASGYGEFVAADFAYALASHELTVVSSASYGADAAALRGAHAAEGSAVAVLSGGADVADPLGHETLLDRVAQTGLVVSEYPPGSPPTNQRARTRRRLLACLGHGTVIVEAARRSAAVELAREANALGKPVMAVPGPVSARTSDGCHDLIRNRHAVLVSEIEQVLAALPLLA